MSTPSTPPILPAYPPVGPRFARKSFSDYYQCAHPWPNDCMVQCGDNGIVLKSHSIQDVLSDPDKTINSVIAVLDPSTPSTPSLPFTRTAFFEAFPRIPDTFIRGEGPTLQEAEQSAWDQYQKYLLCDGSNLATNGIAIHGPYDPRSYENGAGFCVKCGLWFPRVVPSPHSCQECGTLTWYARDNSGGWWCKDHSPHIPQDKLTPHQIYIRQLNKEMDQQENPPKVDPNNNG
jgi:hypothetical protein